MFKFTVAIKALLAGSMIAFSTFSGAYTPLNDQWGETPAVLVPIACEIAPHFPGCQTPRPRWDDCPHGVRYEPGVWPHFPCSLPKPWGVSRFN